MMLHGAGHSGRGTTRQGVRLAVHKGNGFGVELRWPGDTSVSGGRGIRVSLRWRICIGVRRDIGVEVLELRLNR
jgi:hypothetical protein